MVMEGERETAETRLQLQGHDDAEWKISASEQTVGRPPLGLLALNHDAIHELGCRIVAQALEVTTVD